MCVCVCGVRQVCEWRSEQRRLFPFTFFFKLLQDFVNPCKIKSTQYTRKDMQMNSSVSLSNYSKTNSVYLFILKKKKSFLSSKSANSRQLRGESPWAPLSINLVPVVFSRQLTPISCLSSILQKHCSCSSLIYQNLREITAFAYWSFNQQ